jgi:formate hydrogenlyase transcriptional activator
MLSSNPLAEQYRALLEVTDSIAVHRDLAELFRDLVKRLPRIITCSSISMALHDPDRNTMQMHILEHVGPGPLAPGMEQSVEDVPGGWVLQHQQPFVCTNVEQDTRFPKVMPMVRLAGIRSFCVVPLTTARRRLGAMGVGSKEEHHYEGAELDFLQQVAKQVAVSVENALNFECARRTEQVLARQLEREHLMLEINNAVLSHLELPELLKAVSACLSRVIPHDFAMLCLYESATNQLRAHALNFPINQGLLERSDRFPLEGTPPGLAFTSRKTVLTRKLDLMEYPAEVMKRAASEGLTCGCDVPLISRERALGTLSVVSRRENAFTEDDAELLGNIGTQVAIAVENTLHFEQARSAEQELRLLLEINNAVVSHLDLPELLRTVSACLKRVLPHDLAGIALYDSETRLLVAHALNFPHNQDFVEMGDSIPIEGTPEGLAFTSREPVLIKKLDLKEFPAEMVKRGASEGLRSGCAVPLISRDRTLGTLSVVSLKENAFTEDDAKLLRQIGDQIAIAVENGLAYREIENLKTKLNKEKLYLEEEIRSDFEEIVGDSPAMKQVLKQVGIVAPTDSTVLILGETGTGKELLARAIHDRSKRREGTFVKLNCAAIPTGLLESELFGHEKGAFTGAIATKIGRFELADGGTLFLDEVGDIPLELQSKLLRVLQEQEFERLGSTRTIKVKVRLLAATNRDLLEMVENKQFRSDLYYRLNVFPIRSPSLRDRAGDIPLLVRYFTQRISRQMEKRVERIPAETMEALCRYRWPGNVRELENLIERAVILSQGAELHVPLGELKIAARESPSPVTTLHAAERDHILRALEKTDWVIAGPSGAAALLGMKRSTLQSKMIKLGISRRS